MFFISQPSLTMMHLCINHDAFMHHTVDVPATYNSIVDCELHLGRFMMLAVGANAKS